MTTLIKSAILKIVLSGDIWKMKRWSWYYMIKKTVTLFLILSTLLSSVSFAKDIDETGINNISLVQLRPALEKLGFKIEWNAITKSIVSIKDELTITITIGSRVGYIGDIAIQLESEPTIINNNTFVLSSFISKLDENIESIFSFRNTNWGMSIDEVKKSEEGLTFKESIDNSTIIFSLGYTTYLIYTFIDDKLIDARVEEWVLHPDDKKLIDSFNKSKKVLTKKYGDPVYDTSEIITDPKSFEYLTNWETEDGKINLVLRYKDGFYEFYTKFSKID